MARGFRTQCYTENTDRKKQTHAGAFYPQHVHALGIVTVSFEKIYFLMKAVNGHSFCLDPELVRVHDGYGSKRFEGQQAWREVADPER